MYVATEFSPSLNDNAEKIFVFIINCREKLWFWLSDFEANAIPGSVGFDNYDKS